MAARASFGRFELDLATGALMRDGVRIRLQPQPARVLVVLVREAGEIVARETLRQQVWPGGTFVDFERGLNFCIAQVRSALGDSADSPRFIETLPKRGYRFIAPVRFSEAPQSNLAPTSKDPQRALRAASEEPESGLKGTPEEPQTDPRRSPDDPETRLRATPQQVVATKRVVGWGRRGGAVGWVVGFAMVTAGIMAVTHWARTADPAVRVAVVPFDNETGMDDFDRIARSVADATVARLATPARIGRLAVIGNAAALHQPRRFRDLKRIGLELGADYIVLAQMKRDASQVRLIAHLIRVADESHVWANTFDAPEFTLEVQSRIAETIAASIASILASPSSPRTRS